MRGSIAVTWSSLSSICPIFPRCQLLVRPETAGCALRQQARTRAHPASDPPHGVRLAGWRRTNGDNVAKIGWLLRLLFLGSSVVQEPALAALCPVSARSRRPSSPWSPWGGTIAESAIKDMIHRAKRLGDAMGTRRREREARLRAAGFEGTGRGATDDESRHKGGAHALATRLESGVANPFRLLPAAQHRSCSPPRCTGPHLPPVREC